MWTDVPLLRKFLRLNFLVLSAKLLAAEQPERKAPDRDRAIV